MAQKTCYFAILCGLRGCYMPDSVYHHKVTSFREFAAILQEHSDSFLDMVTDDESIRAAWDHIRYNRPMELCFATEKANPSYGLTISSETQKEYREGQKEN